MIFGKVGAFSLLPAVMLPKTRDFLHLTDFHGERVGQYRCTEFVLVSVHCPKSEGPDSVQFFYVRQKSCFVVVFTTRV